MTVDVTGPGGERGRLRAAYVVGADGMRSSVRTAVGLPFPGRSVIRSVVLADVRLAEQPGTLLTVNAVGDAFAFIAPFGDGYHRVVGWHRGRNAPDDAPLDLDEIKEITRLALGRDFGMHDARWMSRFHSDERQAPAYRVGRVFLAGDAAHVHTPAGGQGMNTGLQDAANLSWKLVQVLGGHAPGSLLDTYQAERHPVGRTVLRSSGGIVRLAMADRPGGPVDDRHVRRDAPALDVGNDGDVQGAERVEDRFVLAEGRAVRCAGPADEDGVRAVEEAGEPHAVQLATSGERVALADLHVHEESLGGPFPGEGGDVEVRRPGQVAQHVDAAADQSALGHHVAVAVAAQTRPAAPRVERVLAYVGVEDVVVEAHGPVASGRGLREAVAGWRGHDVQPGQQPVRHAVGRVHEVVAVQGRRAREQREGSHQGRHVGEADDPRRFGFTQPVPVEQRDQVDRGLPAPRRHDRLDGGVGEHRHQLVRTLGGRGADVPGTVHAGSDDDLVPPCPYVTEGDVQPSAHRFRHSARRSGHTDTVTGTQGHRKAH
ncbi:3-(3-hydroxy-phenyl)propionate/3-hydroxycinnamic acid hydroxylase [Streptomyces griseomycini]